MGIDRISWDGKEFHAYPFIATPRLNYLYDEDADGAFVLRNSDNIRSASESDYMSVHFQLEGPQLKDGEIFVNGDWTNGSFSDEYKMQYDEGSKLYQLTIPLKLGYYNYQYLFRDGYGRIHPLPSEGSFYQTENSYQALVYYREQGGRTDRLVGYNSIKFVPR